MRHLIVAFFLLSNISLYSQNLVPNPSFEDTILCPDAGAQVNRAAGWYIAEQTPDYFHSCCIYPQFCVPQNHFDYQYAASGYAYCGFYAYSTVDTNYREKIGIQLLNPLSIGTKYFVSLSFSATKEYLNGGCNKLGVLFSTVQYSPTNPSPTNNYCQIWTDSIIKDTINWVMIKGSFVADSAYAFLTIGNFFINSSTDTLGFWSTNALQAYYFIDDVCVSIDSNNCLEINSASDGSIENDKNIKVVPNPASTYITVKTNFNFPAFLEIYSLEGVLLLNKGIIFINSEWNEDISKFKSGFYIIRINSKENQFITKILINH